MLHACKFHCCHQKNNKVMRIFFLVLFYFALSHVAAFKAPVCTGLSYTSVLRNCTTDDTIFIQSFDLDVQHSNNRTHPNHLRFSNMITWSLNDQKYFQGSPLYWEYINTMFINPNPRNEPFEIDFLDASGTYGLQVWINQSTIVYRTELMVQDLLMVVSEGRIFENNFGRFFDPVNNPCFDTVSGELCIIQHSDNTYISQTTACCKTYVDIEYPDNHEGYCTEFLTEATVTDSDGTSVIDFEAHYFMYNDKIEISVTNFSSYYNNSFYYHIPNFIAGDFCYGDVNQPLSKCSIEFPTEDFQYNLVLDLYSEGNFDEFLPVIAQIIRRNGSLFHSDNIPYSPENPCFKKTTYDPFNTNLIAKDSSCCIKFGEAIIAPTTPPPITPTKPSGFCLKYFSKTNLSDASASLEVEYQIEGQSPKHAIHVWVEYFAKEFSALQFEAYSTDTFSYSCLASTDDPKANCTLKFSDTHKYELQMRTSLMPAGFNMVKLTEENDQFITPLLTPSNPCYTETNPYNDQTSNVLATTEFCCLKLL